MEISGTLVEQDGNVNLGECIQALTYSADFVVVCSVITLHRLYPRSKLLSK